MTIDPRFTHEGRRLGDWLLQLVDESASKRREAYRVIINRFFMPEELLLLPGANAEELMASFRAAVRDTVQQAGFPASDYVQKLFTLSMALEAQRMEAWGAKTKEDDAWHDAQHTKLGANPTPAEVRRYVRRAWVRLCRECRDADKVPLDEALETGIAIAYVIEALGEELLPAAALLRHMLNETHQKHIASDAIGRMGRAGLEFYPDLLRGLERNAPNGNFSKPLGILMRTVPEKIPEVLSLVSSGNAEVRKNAVAALGHCGRETLVRFPEVEARLLSGLRDGPSEEWFGFVEALGEVAVTPEAVSALLEATYSPDNQRASFAISSLGGMGREPDRVVPRLVELLDQFKEPDPDWCYDGHHSRVVTALKAFGSRAAPAIPSLLKRIWTEPEQYYDPNRKLAERPNPDQAVIELLGELGPAAAEALPILREMKTEFLRRCLEERAVSAVGESNENYDEESCCPDYVKEAMGKIGKSM